MPIHPGASMYKSVLELWNHHPRMLLGVILFVQTGLLAWASGRHSPGIDEVGHIAAGLHHWKTGTFDLYRVNPPLVRLIATLPLAAVGIELPGGKWDTKPPARPEFDIGHKFVDLHGQRAYRYFTIARWCCLPFAWLGTFVIYLWGNTLYGRAGSHLAAALWALCPTVLANYQLITPDPGATSIGLLACYLFSRWIQKADWGIAFYAGVVLGLACLTKATWILLPAIWLGCWILLICRPQKGRVSSRLLEFKQLLTAFFVALYVLNAGYAFEGFGQRLGEYRFISQSLTSSTGTHDRVNCFRGTWLGKVPVPLPANYLQGIDVQKRDFESGMRSYLRGEWRTEGWWYYYLYALSVKLPLGTLFLFGLAAIHCFLPAIARPGWREELLLLCPGIVVLFFVSSQTGFNHHLRYILPSLPFTYIWLGRVVAYAGPRRWLWGTIISCSFVAAIGSSLRVYPHSMSYFNEAVGGPMRGSEHLVDSNIDWGQDLLNLKRWLNKHPEAQPLGLAYFGYVDPRTAGIEFTLPPRGPTDPSDRMKPERGAFGPLPGWYAISVTMLRGFHYPLADGRGGMVYIEGEGYEYFLRYQPVARAGYSIWIYYLSHDECNTTRREMGLPPVD